jgi:hypothetical protein
MHTEKHSAIVVVSVVRKGHGRREIEATKVGWQSKVDKGVPPRPGRLLLLRGNLLRHRCWSVNSAFTAAASRAVDQAPVMRLA